MLKYFRGIQEQAEEQQLCGYGQRDPEGSSSTKPGQLLLEIHFTFQPKDSIHLITDTEQEVTQVKVAPDFIPILFPTISNRP